MKFTSKNRCTWFDNSSDYSGEHGNRNLAYAELVAKVENATLLFNLSQGRRDYETEHFNATRGQGAVWYKWNNWLTTLNNCDLFLCGTPSAFLRP